MVKQDCKGKKVASTKIDELRDKANRLPLLPGVYIMKDARGDGDIRRQGEGAEKPRDQLFPRRPPAQGCGDGGEGGRTSTSS